MRGSTDVRSLLAAALLAAFPVRAAGAPAEPAEVVLFRDAAVRFDPSPAGDSARAPVEESGRVVLATADLPDRADGLRVKARIRIRPVAQDERTVHDRYDRAGSLRLRSAGGPDLEIVRFVTSYGGETEHVVDVSHLSPLLQGRRTFAVFIDTWVSPAWAVDASLRFEPDTTYDNPTWAAPVFLSDSFNSKVSGDGEEARVRIPEGLARVVLYYTSTGHCTDGIDEDEFVSKANVISVDGVAVRRFHPWRDDCRSFRDRNPYTARWSDGSWSSDYSRSGWCPGDAVLPVEIDLTDHLTPGDHVIRFVIEKMRPEDEKGQYGYWRVSAGLAGWDHDPKLWRN